MRNSAFLLLCAILVSAVSYATDNNDSKVYVESGQNRVELLELYTSEGCSSCPPADDWLSGFTERDDLWTRVVPIAFHVDYWDYIGWPDRFASPVFTDRQRSHAARLGMRTIYTPGVFLSGSEWQRWRSTAPDFSAVQKSGQLDAVVDTAEGAFSARFIPDTNTDAQKESLVLHTAVLGFDVTSEVDRGENKGRELRHDFVVLGYQKTNLDVLDQDADLPVALAQIDAEKASGSEPAGTRGSVAYFTQAELPPSVQPVERKAIAFWISASNSSEPLQAAGGWL